MNIAMLWLKFPTAQSASMISIFSIARLGRKIELRSCYCTVALIVPDVSAAVGVGLANQYHLVAPTIRLWTFVLPDPKSFAYTFDHLAQIIEDFTEQLHLDTTPVHAGLRWPGGFSYGLGSSRKSFRR